MKRCIALTLSVSLIMTAGACSRLPVSPSVTVTIPVTSITITIGDSVFLAKLYDNETAASFLALLPMTLIMSELNGNEKYSYLPDDLPSDSRRVASIHHGDLYQVAFKTSIKNNRY